MEDIDDDDDFGDIYADVVAQVSSVFNNGEPNFTKVFIEQDIDTTSKKCDVNEGLVVSLGSGNDNGKFAKMVVVEGNGEKVKEEEEEVVGVMDNGSDSEDDLNIVLNDEDCPVVVPVNGGGVRNEGGGDCEEGDDLAVVAEGDGFCKNHSDGLEQGLVNAERGHNVKGSYNHNFSQYKFTRPHAGAFPSTAKGSRSAGVGSSSSMFARGDWENNEWNQRKGAGSSQVARNHMKTFPMVSRNAHGFSLPWYRTILDVSIDTFEQKPWRHSGVDVTAFFNFGFNEQSWKDYCNSVEQFRQQGSMMTRIPAYDALKYDQAYEAGYEHENMSQEATDEETAHAGQPKGRAIQVEGSTGERQSSMDVMHPCIGDSDVVIQITVQDATENSSGSEKEGLDHKHIVLDESSENRPLGLNDTCCPGSASGDKLSTESLEGSIRRLDSQSAALRRCSPPGASSDRLSMDSDKHGNCQISDMEEHQHGKIHSSEGHAEAVESLRNTEEGVGRNLVRADPCIMETESSYGDHIQLSPSLSCFGSHSEASEDGVYKEDPGEIEKPFRRPSQSDESDCNFVRGSDSNNIRRKPGYCNRIPIQERQTHCSRRRHAVAELNPAEVGGSASPLSDKEVLYSKDYESFCQGRQKERLPDFGSYPKEDISYVREAEISLGYLGERFADVQFRNSYPKRLRGKRLPRFRNEVGPYLKRKYGERGDFHDRRITRLDNETLERDWNHRERVGIEDIDYPIYRESRQLVTKYSFADKGKDTQWRGKTDGQNFKKRNDGGDPWLECGHADDFMHEKNRRAAPFTDKEWNSFDDRYEKRLPCTGSKMKNFSRRDRYGDSPTTDMDCLQSMGMENDCRRRVNRRLFPSRPLRGSHTYGGRWHNTVSPRDNVFNLGRGRERFAERCRDGDWFGSYNDACDTEDGILYHDNKVRLGRNGYNRQSEVFRWTENELISRHRDDEVYDEKASFPHKKNSRHERIHATYRSSHAGMVIDENQIKQQRYKPIREEIGGPLINTSSNLSYNGMHEKTIHTCRDSVDLVVGEGKSSGRCTEADSLMWKGKLDKLDLENDKEPTTTKDINHSVPEKVDQFDIPKVESDQDDEKCLDKFPVTEYYEALDLEEGQIVTDEPETEVAMEKEHYPESAGLTGNVKKGMFHNDVAANGSEDVGGVDNHRILQTLAKMEKRRERFKEPLTLKKEADINLKPQVDTIVEIAETNQQRPARKRRWGGS